MFVDNDNESINEQIDFGKFWGCFHDGKIVYGYR
jgi:hypothetical protein